MNALMINAYAKGALILAVKVATKVRADAYRYTISVRREKKAGDPNV